MPASIRQRRRSGSVQRSPRGHPELRLAGDGGDVFEVGVVVEDHRAMLLGNRSSKYVESPSGTMHGFLNLFLMTGFARESYKPDVLEELMEEEFSEVFHFDDQGITWRGENTLSVWQIERLRRLGFQSFGSCSFEEPIEDLKALGLL